MKNHSNTPLSLTIVKGKVKMHRTQINLGQGLSDSPGPLPPGSHLPYCVNSSIAARISPKFV